jgi:hypothetical protein
MLILKHITMIFLFLTLGVFRESLAEEYYWRVPEHDIPYPLQPKHPSPDSVCRWLYKEYDATWLYTPANPADEKNKWECPMYYGDDYDGAIPVIRFGDTCEAGKNYNQLNGQCEIESFGGSCPSSFAGNPIDFSTGYKTQSETDYAAPGKGNRPNPASFSRAYSSVKGVWTHNYAFRLIIDSILITLIHADGKESTFEKAGQNFSPKHPERGMLTRENHRWRYQSPDNYFYEFDDQGRLLAIRNLGATQNIEHTEKNLIVTDAYGARLEITEDARKQPKKLVSENITIDYTYDKYKQLKQVTRHYKAGSDKKEYLYEDPKNSTLLTAIKDERGIRYASWTYDDQGRAISSEHAGGAEKIRVHYNTDGSTTVINELGKKTNYIYDFIQGIKHITAINGEPSANCPDSNSTFTYDERGLLKTKTDNNVNVTTYTHNDRGLETSRTEASGTPDFRTIFTEWHPTLFSPVRITQPGRLIQYNYDPQGRQLSQTATSR